MKKIFVLAAIFVAMCSCTNDSYFETENVEEISAPMNAKANKGHWDNSEEFFQICVKTIDVHKDFPGFAEILPKKLAKKVEKGNYNENEAVEIIWIWYCDGFCWDILIEWCYFEDFLDLLPEKYANKYHFCC